MFITLCVKCDEAILATNRFIYIRNIVEPIRVHGILITSSALLMQCNNEHWWRYGEDKYPSIKEYLKIKATENWWEFQKKYAPGFYAYYYPLKHLYTEEDFR